MAWAAGLCLAAAGGATAQDPYASSTDFAKYAEHLRDSAVLQMQPPTTIPVNPYPAPGTGLPPGAPFNPAVPYQWKTSIVTTVFWVGEPAGSNNPVNNVASSWDLSWALNFGGMDDPNPANRRDFVPVKFKPRLNPFYIALPYNDVTKGSTKPESRLVIPWYENAFVEEGRSVCRDRWIAIRNPRDGRVCYAQWSDCGPFRTDHWQYVFGTDRPRPFPRRCGITSGSTGWTRPTGSSWSSTRSRAGRGRSTARTIRSSSRGTARRTTWPPRRQPRRSPPRPVRGRRPRPPGRRSACIEPPSPWNL